MKEKTYKTKVPLYQTQLRFIVTDDVPKCVKSHLADEERGVLAITAWIKGVLTVIIPEGASMGLIAHEAVHVATEVLSHHAVKWGPKNDEPHAYIVGAVLDWVEKKVNLSLKDT